MCSILAFSLKIQCLDWVSNKEDVQEMSDLDHADLSRRGNAMSIICILLTHSEYQTFIWNFLLYVLPTTHSVNLRSLDEHVQDLKIYITNFSLKLITWYQKLYATAIHGNKNNVYPMFWNQINILILGLKS